MGQTAVLSTIIDLKVKKAITQFCKQHGFKLRHVIEQALVERIEDEIDLQAYFDRQDEETVPLSRILSKRSKQKN